LESLKEVEVYQSETVENKYIIYFANIVCLDLKKRGYASHFYTPLWHKKSWDVMEWIGLNQVATFFYFVINGVVGNIALCYKLGTMVVI
jgi:hypothetical protein